VQDLKHQFEGLQKEVLDNLKDKLDTALAVMKEYQRRF
jgi:hypothetical protein